MKPQYKTLYPIVFGCAAVLLLAVVLIGQQTGGGQGAVATGSVISGFTGCSGNLYLGADGACHATGSWVDVTAKGATGNGQVVHDAVTNGTTTVTSASALFAAGDVGKSVICVGCNAGVNLVTTIATFNSSSSIALSASPALTLPINIICTGCTTTPYGYATVNSSGAITGGVVVANGTSGAASCVANIIGTQQSQSGSGGTLNCAVAGGVVSALTVNAAGSGYFATLYWATDDSAAFASAMTASFTTNTCMYVPPAPKKFYMMNTQLNWLTNTCIFGAGQFSRSYILGDPCTSSCTSFPATSLILRNGSSNQEMWGLHLDNVHAISASPTDAFASVVDCEACGQGFDHNIFVTACRDCFHSAATSSSVASNMRHEFIYCTGFVDACIHYQGASGQASLNTNVQIASSHMFNMICTELGPYPCHDISMEDSGGALVDDNYISDNFDSTLANEGGIAFFGNHVTGYVAYIDIHHNYLNEANPSTTSTLNCFTFVTTSTIGFNNLQVDHNICLGASTGFAMLNVANPLSLPNIKIDGNQFESCGWGANGCIAITATGGLVAINGTINSNAIFGAATGAGLGPCLNLTLIANTEIQGNNITWCPTYGIQLSGVQGLIINGNTVFNNSQSASATYDGIILQSSGATVSHGNTISNNEFYDNQGASQKQRYGINIAALQYPGNKLIGNTFPNGANKTANINDAALATGSGNCTLWEGTIGCDNEQTTINSLAAVTLIPGTFNTNNGAYTYEVKIAWACTAVASSTLQWQVNYFSSLQGANTSQTGPSHSCASATEGSDIFFIKHTSGGANVVSYQAVVTNTPAFRDKATVQLQ